MACEEDEEEDEQVPHTLHGGGAPQRVAHCPEPHVPVQIGLQEPGLLHVQGADEDEEGQVLHSPIPSQHRPCAPQPPPQTSVLDEVEDGGFAQLTQAPAPQIPGIALSQIHAPAK